MDPRLLSRRFQVIQTTVFLRIRRRESGGVFVGRGAGARTRSAGENPGYQEGPSKRRVIGCRVLTRLERRLRTRKRSQRRYIEGRVCGRRPVLSGAVYRCLKGRAAMYPPLAPVPLKTVLIADPERKEASAYPMRRRIERGDWIGTARRQGYRQCGRVVAVEES